MGAGETVKWPHRRRFPAPRGGPTGSHGRAVSMVSSPAPPTDAAGAVHAGALIPVPLVILEPVAILVPLILLAPLILLTCSATSAAAPAKAAGVAP
jgi:hypothetical protein